MTEKVLIVDDDPAIRLLMEAILRPEGYDLLQAGDGAEALELLRGEMPDLVVLDVLMPKIDGVEVCRQLREDPRTRSTSVIMLTARALSADVLVGLAAGADDYVIKPFHPVELLARVKSTLRRARQMRDASPLTGLPGNSSILQELRRRVEARAPYALMHVDLDNFKAVNDRYGFLRGDAAIKLLGSFIQDVVAARDPSGFVGHIGGDDFAVICDAGVAEDVAAEIIARFDRAAPGLYDDEDRERGHITVPDRSDQLREYPLLSVSIGIATTARRPIESHVEAGEIAAQMKSVAKRRPGSAYAVDRRGARTESLEAPVTASGPSAPSR
ncbi:MAG: GGDEF domain-containing response regulator [Actinomycetota bacterium]